MLTGRGQWASGACSTDSAFAFGSCFRAHGMRRSGLLFDTRFMRGASATRDVVTLYLVGGGESAASTGAAHRGACLWILSEAEFERATGDGPTLRTWGFPATVMDLCVPRTFVRETVGIGIAHGPRPLPAAVPAALSDLIDARTMEATEAAFGVIARSLTEARTLTGELCTKLGEPEPTHLVRLWDAIRVPYERHDTSAYLKLIAELLRLSPRQVQRDLTELSARLGLDGFRTAVRTMRLRRAVLLLSAELTVREVAEHVGYGSADAMGRAFRDSGLPPPSVVQAAVRCPPLSR